MLETLSRNTKSGCLGRLYTDDLALVNETKRPERETGNLERSTGDKS